MKLLAATIALLLVDGVGLRPDAAWKIQRNGSQPSGKGPAETFTGTVACRSALSGARSGAHIGWLAHLRAGSTQRLHTIRWARSSS